MHAPQRDPTTVAFESGVSLFGDIRRYRLANLFPRLIRAPSTPHLHPLTRLQCFVVFEEVLDLCEE